MVNKQILFLEKIKKLYPDCFGTIIKSIENPKPLSFRINKLKADPEKVLETLQKEGFEFLQGPSENSYILNSSKKRLSETKAFTNGYIYIQNLSSMLPALELAPKTGEKIIDLCAAPGSKTSQIADLTKNKAEITAVENNRNRFFALQKNLENLSVKNVTLLLENARFLDKTHPEFLEHFDKVLVDAPCSNEGLLVLSAPKSFEKWNPKLPKHLSKLQKALLATGINLLKKGGTLVYSTCTYSKEENEEVVEWAIKKFPEMTIEKMKRVIPNELFTGFFLAKLSKHL
jgi:NOL1/NOP2/sun family putative RNA methylase